MLFNSLSFVLFFLVTGLCYYGLPRRFRWVFLLVVSCYFYMAFVPAYILILFFLIGLDYFLGLRMERTRGKMRTYLLLVSVLANIGTLFLFKYFNFFNDNLSVLAQWLHWNYSSAALHLILPLGLSFHVFQSLSYIIEVYYGRQKAERHLGIYALYVMFFPQLVAGPIERPQHLLPQLREPHAFDGPRVLDGLKLMLWGFFKKLVIADRLSLLVDHVYGHIPQANGLTLAVATVAFAIQIYCDFSGYSDIAVGAARVLGYRLVKNFDRPYAATSIPDFWRRWHISLFSWFRDYVYIPLGGSRVSAGRKYANILIVFLLSGLWHGASWHYVIWGLWHGALMIASGVARGLRLRVVSVFGLARHPRLHRVVQIIFTNALVCIGWIFFRSANVSEAVMIIRRIVSDFPRVFDPSFLADHVISAQALGIGWRALIVIILSIALMMGRSFLLKETRPTWLRVVGYQCVMLWILLFAYMGEKTFIYFQF